MRTEPLTATEILRRNAEMKAAAHTREAERRKLDPLAIQIAEMATELYATVSGLIAGAKGKEPDGE